MKKQLLISAIFFLIGCLILGLTDNPATSIDILIEEKYGGLIMKLLGIVNNLLYLSK